MNEIESEMIKKCFEMGINACGIFKSPPHENKELMALLPKCTFDNKKLVKLRIDMMTAYIKGWTREHHRRIDEELEDMGFWEPKLKELK